MTCKHIVGFESHAYADSIIVEYWEEEKYWDEVMTWFKFCPHCGIPLDKGKIIDEKNRNNRNKKT